MKHGVSQRRRETQSGFILLVIFLMAAMIAMMLYQQLPRVAFESERDKEQLLIERGEQYARAIELFAKEYQKLPATIDELEKTNNKRYLRKRYVDPYTKKDEWRLIHATGPGGQLTDSLVQKPTDPNASNSSSSSSSSASSSNGQQEPEVNAAVNLRPSDVTLPGAQNFQGPLPGSQQLPDQPGMPLAPSPNQGMNAPQSVPQGVPQFGMPGQGLPTGIALPGGVQTSGAAGAQGQQGQPGQGQPQGRGQQPGQGGTQGFTPQFPGQQFPGQAPPAGFQPQFPGQQFPGQLPPTGVQAPQTGQTLPNGQPIPVGFQMGPNGQLVPAPVGANTGPQQGGILPPGTPALPGGAQNQGINIIQQILTTPRSAPTATAQSPAGAGGGGIAGVASLYEGPSIAVYKERQKYQEWEFIYVPQQGAAGGIMPGGVNNGQNNGKQNGQNNGTNNGNSGFGNSGLGNSGLGNSGFGNSGFGNNGGANPGRGGSSGSFGTGGNTPNNGTGSTKR